MPALLCIFARLLHVLVPQRDTPKPDRDNQPEKGQLGEKHKIEAKTIFKFWLKTIKELAKALGEIIKSFLLSKSYGEL